jgi:hypothetical protein
MLRSATIVLAILLALGSFGFSADAFARDGGYRAGGPGVGVRGDKLAGGLDYGNRANGLCGEFRGCRNRDVWGHWGAYYGPMIPMI